MIGFYLEIGQCLGRMGKYEEALLKLKSVLEMEMGIEEIIFTNPEIGWLYDRIGNRKEALKYLFAAKDLGRDDVWLNSKLHGV